MAMNLCPCGYLGDPSGRCRCSADQVQRYRAKLSGPLLDRIDMQIEVPRLPLHELDGRPGEPSATIRKRVETAQDRQRLRQHGLNAHLPHRQIDRLCAIRETDRQLLYQVMERFQLSARAYHRILKVARTIADLDASQDIGTPHLSEAIGYRRLDRGQ